MTGQSLIATMAAERGMDPAQFARTLRSTVMPSDHTDEQFAAFMLVAHKYGLDPITKEIYAYPGRKGGINPVLSIDGWIHLVNDHPQCDGFEIVYDEEEDGKLISATCTMWRKDRNHPIVVTEYFNECYRNTDPWNLMPRRMLRHKAFKEAARLAFGFAGIVDEDEARDMRPIALAEKRDQVIDALDEFAAGTISSVSSPTPESPAVPSHEPVGEGGDGNAAPQASSVAATGDCTEAIDKLLALAADPDTTPQDKLQALDEIQPAYVDEYGKPFVAAAFPTIVKVIKGELKPAAARKYMASL